MNIDKNDILIILPLVALLLIGIIMVTSSSIYIADNNQSNPFYFAQMQSLFIAIGILAMIFFLILPSNSSLSSSERERLQDLGLYKINV